VGSRDVGRLPQTIQETVIFVAVGRRPVALSEYTGLTPTAEPDLVVDRVAQHYRWTMDDTETVHCSHCGAVLDLHERHLLVTLSTGESDPVERRHLCHEHCLQQWLGDGEGG
jgi:hypothetical protein